MVQRKSPEKLGIKHDSISNHKSEKKSSSSSSSSTTTPVSENKTSKGGAPDLKKMMKKSRSIKRAAMVTPQKPPQVKIPSSSSPNYMKSTTSSAARKERSQVSPRSSKTPTKKDSDHPKVSSSSSSSTSGHKPGKTLTKTSSLRPVRTLTKTSSNKAGRTLFTDQKVRRATCSSTLKDTKFPKYVSLNPGGTESQGTSVMKVCPYTYCSLNGHHHAPLPPLKCFLSARRKLIKTQKSMRIKSLNSGGRKAGGKPKKGIDTGQLVKEEGLDLDFFVEIYAQPREEDTSKSKEDLFADPLGFEDTLYSSQDGAETEVENDGGEDKDDSSHSATSFEDNIDFIMEEMDNSMFFLRHMQMEEAEKEDSSINGDFITQSESGESEIEDSVFDTSGTDWEEGKEVETHLDGKEDCLGVTTDEHEPVLCLQQGSEELSVDEEVQVVHGENDEYLEEHFDGVDQTLETEISSAISSGGKEGHERDGIITIEASSDGADSLLEEETQSQLEDTHLEEQENDEYLDDHFDGADQALEAEISSAISSEVKEGHEIEDSPLEEQTQGQPEENGSSEPEIDQATAKETPEAGADDGTCLQEAEHRETEQSSTICKDQAEEAEYSEDLVEEINLKHVEDCSTGYLKVETEDKTSAKETSTIIPRDNPGQEDPGNCSELYKHIRRKKDIEEPEEQREFNPRGPRFLPLDPEEDPETVDLRHQMMDERRASEEWMLDYALRQAVSKLAPARKRKVALLVEAFETVSPLAKFEIHLPHTPTGFGHTRFLQACS